jgi:hypothetical protein
MIRWLELDIAAMLLVLFLFGCGAKQPVSVKKPPAPLLPAAGRCSGARAGENVQLTFAVGESNFPKIMWNGKDFTIGWWDMRGRFPTVYTMGVNREGFEVAEPEQIPSQSSAKHHSLAPDRDETFVVWVEDEKVLATRVGHRLPQIEVLSRSGAMPAAGPFGAAVWVDAGKLYFRSDGMVPDKKTGKIKPALIATGGIQDPQIAYNGVFFAVVWSESTAGGRRIVLQRVSQKGEMLGDTVQISAVQGTSRKPSIAWHGGRFAVAWTNAITVSESTRDRYRAFFATLPDGGTAPERTGQLDFNGIADEVALAAAGEEYALSWVGSTPSGGSAIFFQRLDLEGAQRSDPLKVTDGAPVSCSRPSIAWDGNGYAVVWHDDRDQVESEIYFAYVGCDDNAASSDEARKDPSGNDTEPTPAPNDAPALKDVF